MPHEIFKYLVILMKIFSSLFSSIFSNLNLLIFHIRATAFYSFLLHYFFPTGLLQWRIIFFFFPRDLLKEYNFSKFLSFRFLFFLLLFIKKLRSGLMIYYLYSDDSLNAVVVFLLKAFVAFAGTCKDALWKGKNVIPVRGPLIPVRQVIALAAGLSWLR